MGFPPVLIFLFFRERQPQDSASFGIRSHLLYIFAEIAPCFKRLNRQVFHASAKFAEIASANFAQPSSFDEVH